MDIKSRRMRWAGHMSVLDVGKIKNACIVLVEKPEGEGDAGDLAVVGRII
jgi:hypothetical protein